MDKPGFVYVTYIRTTLEKLWAALTDPKTITKYWLGITAECGASSLTTARTADTGETLEAVPCQRLVIRWRNEFKPELKAEGYSRCTMEIEIAGYYPDHGAKAVKLTIHHEIESAGGGKHRGGVHRLAEGVVESQSLLETGDIAFAA